MFQSVYANRPTNILLVEDNEIDVEAALRAFRKARIENPTHHACDGVEALEVLRRKQPQEQISQPCIILLDINMPRMGGIEFLHELRNDDALRLNIVFMLTTSARESDRVAAYGYNVAGYFLKENLGKLTEMLSAYCSGNEFPHQDMF